MSDINKKITDWITVFYNRQHRAPNVSEIKAATGADITAISGVLKSYNFPVAEFKKTQAVQAAQKQKRSTGTELFFIVLFLSISAVCVIVSAFFTAKALYENFNNMFIAFSLSASIILFVALGRAASKKVREKNAIGLSRIVSVLWYVALLYSMYSTTSVQFGEFYAKINLYKQTAISLFKEDKNEADLFKQEQDIREQIADKKEDRQTLANDIKSLKDNLKNAAVTEIKKIQTNIKEKESTRTRLQTEIDEHYQEIRGLYKGNVRETPETKITQYDKKANSYLFFVWLSGIFKIFNPDALQFISALFPTIFIDLIAPIGLLIVTTLQEGQVERAQSLFRRLFDKKR